MDLVLKQIFGQKVLEEVLLFVLILDIFPLPDFFDVSEHFLFGVLGELLDYLSIVYLRYINCRLSFIVVSLRAVVQRMPLPHLGNSHILMFIRGLVVRIIRFFYHAQTNLVVRENIIKVVFDLEKLDIIVFRCFLSPGSLFPKTLLLF